MPEKEKGISRFNSPLKSQQTFYLTALLLTSPCLAAGKSTSELRLIAQAGGFLIVDLSKHGYSASELIAIASSLSHGASRQGQAGAGSLLVLIFPMPSALGDVDGLQAYSATTSRH